MRNIYFLFLLFFFSNDLSAQNNQLYSMFVFNKLQYNPAYAGSKGAPTVGAHYRHQWQGIQGAPRTITLFGHTPLSDKRSGVGFSLISDEIGMFNTYYATGTYAYRITFKNDTKLSLGIQAQYDHARLNWEKLNLLDNQDTGLPIDQTHLSTFNAGVGIYYSGSNFFVGASVPQLIRNAITSDAYQNLGQLNPLRSYYGMGGVVFDLTNNVKLKPSILVSYVPNAPFEIDFNLSVLLMETFWIGGSYRLEESIDAFVQFPVTKNLKLALGVDYATTALNQYTKGSFEIMAEYTFRRQNDGVNNIRFF